MQLHTLQPAKGSIKKRKRAGRGQGSGNGGTCGKGHKGAQSRSGYKRKHYLEGGQMPLSRRVPKFGFKNPMRIQYKPINLDMLQQISEKTNSTTIDPKILQEHSIIGKHPYKILSNGKDKLKSALSVTAHAFSLQAKDAIEKLGGTIKTL